MNIQLDFTFKIILQAKKLQKQRNNQTLLVETGLDPKEKTRVQNTLHSKEEEKVRILRLKQFRVQPSFLPSWLSIFRFVKELFNAKIKSAQLFSDEERMICIFWMLFAILYSVNTGSHLSFHFPMLFLFDFLLIHSLICFACHPISLASLFLSLSSSNSTNVLSRHCIAF